MSAVLADGLHRAAGNAHTADALAAQQAVTGMSCG